MYNLASLLGYVKDGLVSKSPRFQVIDTEHVMDCGTGVEYHLYSDGLKLTHGDEVIMRSDSLKPHELEPLWAIQKMIGTELTTEVIKANRQRLSDLYEFPEPLAPELDDGATDYLG